MGLFSRKKRKAELERQREAQTTALELAPRLERAIMTLAVHSQQMDDRLRHLEERIIKSDSRFEQLPTQADIIAVRVHSAQVLTELAAVSLDMRTELSRMREESRAQFEMLSKGTAMLLDDNDTQATTESSATIAQPSVIDLPQDVIHLGGWDTTVADARATEPPAFLRPDSPEFNPELKQVEIDEPISWGPKR